MATCSRTVGQFISFIMVSCIIMTATHGQADSFISNHSLIFIAGWPQSGTSLIQEFITTSPVVSTMTQKCEEILGKRCINWNHEGQWLLRGTTRQFFNSGAMCASDPHGITAAQRDTVLTEVLRNTSQHVYYLFTFTHCVIPVSGNSSGHWTNRIWPRNPRSRS